MATPLETLIRARRSIRRFLPDPVDREKIRICLDAARLAPSAQNAQPWRFLVVDDPELKAALARVAFSGIYAVTKFAAGAPVIIVVLARPGMVAHRIGRHVQGTQFYMVDIGIAGEHFVLRAEEMGLSTCWIGWFNVRRTRKLLRIPRGHKVVALLPLGYAASRPPSETKRKGLDDISWFNKFGG
jgi:nitroreductase